MNLMLVNTIDAAPFAFITNEGSSSQDGSISVIDIANDTIISKVPGLKHPYGVAVTPDETKVCVTLRNNNSVTIFDTINNTNTSVPIRSPYGIAVSQDGKKVYITSQEIMNVTDEFKDGYYNAYEIDTTNNYAVTSLPLTSASASKPCGIAVDSNGIVYVAYTYIAQGNGQGAVSILLTLKIIMLLKALWL